MLRHILSIIFGLFLFTALGQSSLHYSLQKGDIFLIQQDAEQLITQEMEGFTHELQNKINGLMEFKVTSDNGDSYAIDITFQELAMKIISSVEGELMSVQASELNEADPQSRIFNSLLNVPIEIILAKSGDVLAVNGGDSLITRMTDAAGLPDIESQNALKESLQGEFGSEALSQSFKQMTYFYPEDGQIENDSWRNEYTGKLSAKNEWSLEKSTDSLNHILGSADIIMNVRNGATSMSLSGSQQTTITADSETGFILDMEVTGYSEGTALMGMVDDTEIPTTIKSTTTYKLIR